MMANLRFFLSFQDDYQTVTVTYHQNGNESRAQAEGQIDGRLASLFQWYPRMGIPLVGGTREVRIGAVTPHRHAVPAFRPERGATFSCKLGTVSPNDATDFLVAETSNAVRDEMLREMARVCDLQIATRGGDNLSNFRATSGFFIFQHGGTWMRGEVVALPNIQVPPGHLCALAIDHGFVTTTEKRSIMVMREQFQHVPSATLRGSLDTTNIHPFDRDDWEEALRAVLAMQQASFRATVVGERSNLNRYPIQLEVGIVATDEWVTLTDFGTLMEMVRRYVPQVPQQLTGENLRKGCKTNEILTPNISILGPPPSRRSRLEQAMVRFAANVMPGATVDELPQAEPAQSNNTVQQISSLQGVSTSAQAQHSATAGQQHHATHANIVDIDFSDEAWSVENIPPLLPESDPSFRRPTLGQSLETFRRMLSSNEEGTRRQSDTTRVRDHGGESREMDEASDFLATRRLWDVRFERQAAAREGIQREASISQQMSPGPLAGQALEQVVGDQPPVEVPQQQISPDVEVIEVDDEVEVITPPVPRPVIYYPAGYRHERTPSQEARLDRPLRSYLRSLRRRSMTERVDLTDSHTWPSGLVRHIMMMNEVHDSYARTHMPIQGPAPGPPGDPIKVTRPSSSSELMPTPEGELNYLCDRCFGKLPSPFASMFSCPHVFCTKCVYDSLAEQKEMAITPNELATCPYCDVTLVLRNGQNFGLDSFPYRGQNYPFHLVNIGM